MILLGFDGEMMKFPGVIFVNRKLIFVSFWCDGARRAGFSAKAT
jgi:hypothetical protein